MPTQDHKPAKKRSFFAELKRRHVYRTGVIYLVIAWGVMQVVDVMFDTLQVPDWASMAVAITVVAGFPLALLLAWIYELTPAGVRRTSEEGDKSLAAGTRSASARDSRIRILVLPFENLGPAEDEYFASGITEELTSRLALVRALGVISKTTAVNFTKVGKALSEAGADLAAQFVLEGSVRWARDRDGNSRVRITPRLVRVADDTNLWSDAYDRNLGDILQIQQDIAERVIEKLGVALLGQERDSVESHATGNIEAYQHYLKGLFHARPRGFLEERDRAAVSELQRSIELDPDFALAHAELSITHSALHHYGFDHTQKRREVARASAERALTLAPWLPQSSLAMGYYYYWCERDYDKAYQELEQAETLSPGNSEILAAMGFIRRREQRIEDALILFERAMELNPMDPHFAIQIADTLAQEREYQRAGVLYDQAASFTPDQVAAHIARAGLNWVWKGDLVAARKALEAMPEHAAQSSYGAIYWFWQEIFEGQLDQAQERIDRLTDEVLEPKVKYLLTGQAKELKGDQIGSQAAYEKAREAFHRELDSNPDNHFVLAAIAIAEVGLGRRREALAAIRKAVALCGAKNDEGDTRILRKILALVQLKSGHESKAIEELESLLEENTQDIEYLPVFPGQVSVPMLQLDPRWKTISGRFGV